MEPTLFFVAAVVVGGAALFKRYQRWTARFDDTEHSPSPLEAAPAQDRAFLKLIDEVTAQGGFTRAPTQRHSLNGWQVQTLRRGAADQGDGALVEVELQHAKRVQGGDHRLCVRVNGVISPRLDLQSREEVSFTGLDRHRMFRSYPRNTQQNTTGDDAFDLAFILHCGDEEALAALNAGARDQLMSVNGEADISAKEGQLTAQKRLPQLNVTPQGVLGFVEAALTCARSLRLDTSREGLEAAWLATLRGGQRVEVTRRLLEVLLASGPSSQAVRDGCATLCEDPSQDMGARLGAAKLCGERGWPLLEQTALSAEANAEVRVGALQALGKVLPNARAHALMVALLDDMVSGLGDEPPQPLSADVIYEAARAVEARPCPGVIDKLVTLFWAQRNAAERSERALLALLGAISAQEDAGEVEAAILGLLPSLVERHFRDALGTLQRRGTLAAVLALKQRQGRDDVNDEERALIQDAVWVIQARLSGGQDTGGALSLAEVGEAGALALTVDEPSR